MVAKCVATSQRIFLTGKQYLDLNATDDEGKTALHWSALYNRTNTVKVCIHATLYQLILFTKNVLTSYACVPQSL